MVVKAKPRSSAPRGESTTRPRRTAQPSRRTSGSPPPDRGSPAGRRRRPLLLLLAAPAGYSPRRRRSPDPYCTRSAYLADVRAKLYKLKNSFIQEFAQLLVEPKIKLHQSQYKTATTCATFRSIFPTSR
jgi:hypothetical protein